MKNLKTIIIILFGIILSIDTLAQVSQNTISRVILIEDARYLFKILEESHPDPYKNFGGKIEFNREFQKLLNSIPESGLQTDEFYNLIMPFVAKVGDMHTGLINNSKQAPKGPGLPLEFKIIDLELVITGVPSSDFNNILGSRLCSVMGIQTSELFIRQSKLRGIENKYGEVIFTSRSLKSINGIIKLIPEWNQKDPLKLEFKLKTGEIVSKEFSPSALNKETMVSYSSSIIKPSMEKSDVVYDFIGDSKETILLTITNMERYREASEAWFSSGMESARQYTEAAYSYFNKENPPSNQDELLKGIPSVSETFEKLVNDIKNNKTKNLIIDLRDNTGGNSIMKEILIYYLFGKNGLQTMNQGYQIIKYSDLYFMNMDNDSLPLINKDLKVSLQKSDYNFMEENMYRENKIDFSVIEKMLQRSQTFWNIYKTGKFDKPSFKLENIIVLCSPITTSSGFNLLTSLYEKGAKVLGTASAQPGNNFGDILFFDLPKTNLKGYVSFKQNITFPDDPIKGKCLMPDYPLTYQKFATFNFDPESEILYALELLKVNIKK